MGLLPDMGLPLHGVEHVLSQIVEFAPNGVAVTTSDDRIVLANAELERMFRYSRTELLKSHIERLVPERFRSGHAKLRAGEWKDARQRAMGDGRDLVGLRADGSEFPIEIGISVVQIPEGTIMIESVIDISVRKRLERMFQKVVEAAPSGMIMIDNRGRIVLVNPQTELMFGYARAELIGSSLEMLVPERFRQSHVEHRAAFAAAPAIRQMGVGRDLTARRKDASEFPVEVLLNPVPAEDGALVLATITDITQRKTMQLELRQANANLEEFTYSASHDLKSPLRGISDLVEWIVEDLGGRETAEVSRNLLRIGDRIRRLDRVIDDLLTYARAGATAAESVAVDPRVLITGVLELQPLPAGFQVEAHIEAQPFVAARTPLESVLRNLIGNAVKHHDRPAGKLIIRVKDVDRYCVFSILDDGPGIPVASQSRVFRMFQVLTQGKRGDSGIGLALSKRLVEAHGGRITLESADGVRGTLFSVWWPRFQWRKSND
jgi:PAS domain S-box-containing protein